MQTADRAELMGDHRRGGVFDADVSRSPSTPNTAARWPLSGPAAALDKYEDAPHGVTTVR